MDQQSEREIADGVRNGQTRAWQQFYDECAPRLWRSVARLMGGRSSDVADVVQETFLAAVRSASGFDPVRGRLWPWLWGIARRQVALHYRRQDRAELLGEALRWVESLNGQSLGWITGETDAPQDVLESRELATLVRAVLCELPPEYETLLTMKYVDDLSVDQIVQEIGGGSEAVRSRLARARRSFRLTLLKRMTPPKPPVDARSSER